ncbi:MAG: hypothetical protein ACP5M9_04540 [Candidatus Micrarchaeia archaeon]
MDVTKLSLDEKRKTMEALMLITEKRDKSIKKGSIVASLLKNGYQEKMPRAQLLHLKV